MEDVAREAIAGERATRRRHLIVGLLFVTGAINYIDRTNLSIVAPAIAGEFHLDMVATGWLFSSFGWAYAASQIPAGWLVDRMHPRILYTAAIVMWSMATLLQGIAGSFAALVALRLLVGLFESPSYLINNRIVTAWFPESERATAIAIYTSAQFVGLGTLAPAIGWIAITQGWRAVFIYTGLLGLVWGGIWLRYRDPPEFAKTNPAEIAHIQKGGGIPDIARHSVTQRAAGISAFWKDLRVVLSRRKLLGLFLLQYTNGASQSFFFTWFPTYLVHFRHMSFVHAGFFEAVPFIAGFFGVLSSGIISDALLRRGASLAIARTVPMLTGLVLSSIIVLANYVQNEYAVLAIFAFAFFCGGLGAIAWSLVSSLAPERLIGLTGSAFNCAGWLAGITVPIAIGYFVRDGNFAPALFFVGALPLFGTLSYLLLIGKIERVQE